MPQESTLLSFIAQRYTTRLEDVATDALSFILSRSTSAKEALSEFLGDDHGPMPIAKVQPWRPNAHGDIPDVAGVDEDGDPVALIESKFWASLTHNLPVTYWEDLPADKPAVLLFLAPDYRVGPGALWDELEAKLRNAGYELGPPDKSNGRITAPSKDDQRRLLLTTWQLLLDRMALRAKEDGDNQACFEIDELQGLAAAAAEGDRPTRDDNLKQLIADSVKRVEQLNWAKTDGLTVGQGTYYYGRYLRLAGAYAFLGFYYRALKEMPERPLWLSFEDSKGGVSSKLEGKTATGLEWAGWEVNVPIDLPAGTDREKALEAIVTQLESIAELIDPEGPTYR